MKNKHKHFGKSFNKDISFPKHLTPEIIHSALFIHNAPTKEEIVIRSEYCAKQIGNEAMSYAMALLIMPWLMEQGKDSTLYKDFISSRKKTIN